VFWSGVGFLNSELPETMTSAVGLDWSAEAARSYLSFVSVTSHERRRSTGLVIVLAAPCHPSQLYGLTLLADAGLLAFVVLLEKRKPKSWGVFDKRDSSTGHYLCDIGMADCGWVEWDAGSKADLKLEQILGEIEQGQPSFFVVCCRDSEATEEPTPLISDGHLAHPPGLMSTSVPQLQTVFGKFLRSLAKMVPSESIFWVPPQISDLGEFRRQLALFRKIQQGTPGRPILALDSAVLPILYSDIRDWCESPDRDNPIFLVYQSGLPPKGRSSVGGLTDGLLLLSIPSLNLAVPADEEEAKTLFSEADALAGPTALAFCQSPAVGLSTLSTANPARGRSLREGKDVALVAIGSTVFPCLLAAESLRSVGLSVAVFDLRYRRPLDTNLIDGLNRFPLIVSVDEHPEAGGISGHLWRPERASCKLIRLGISVEAVQELVDRQSGEELTLEHFGLHAEGIARVVRESLRLAPPSAFG
jgi:Transketolase, C-terminal domain